MFIIINNIIELDMKKKMFKIIKMSIHEKYKTVFSGKIRIKKYIKIQIIYKY